MVKRITDSTRRLLSRMFERISEQVIANLIIAAILFGVGWALHRLAP